jgi:hypothetical protein
MLCQFRAKIASESAHPVEHSSASIPGMSTCGQFSSEEIELSSQLSSASSSSSGELVNHPSDSDNNRTSIVSQVNASDAFDFVEVEIQAKETFEGADLTLKCMLLYLTTCTEQHRVLANAREIHQKTLFIPFDAGQSSGLLSFY